MYHDMLYAPFNIQRVGRHCISHDLTIAKARYKDIDI